jgi:hypothetical protein
MNWKDVPLPEKMLALPKDARGFSVPFIVACDETGKPQFTVNDRAKVMHALTNGLCGICGQGIPMNDVWLVGGPQSAFHPQGAYIDGPLHGDCARYALQVCPYLAVSNVKYRSAIDAERLSGRFKDTTILIDPTVDPDRPKLFALVRITGLSMTPNGYLVPDRPYPDAEYWNGGQRLDEAEALEVLASLGLTPCVVRRGVTP